MQYLQNSVLYVYLVLINLTGFIIIRSDKIKSQNNGWRVKENTIYLISLAGGVFGVFVSMRRYRHKTMKTMYKLTKLNLILYSVLIILIVIK